MDKLLKFSNKALSFVWDNILFYETLFLLVFIPLFPKIPILDVKNTWVSIRTEDFVVLFVLLSWLVLLLRKKITLRTPLTIPILIFWIIGGIATIHGVILIFPNIANVFPNVAFLNVLRHIEYMSLFFIAYHGIKDKKQLPVIIATLVVTLLAVVGYGFGQKYLEFPAYLTMNEEFAKGIPIQLSALSRVPSTFAGHYDLAAYLVLIIPIFASLFFGVRNWGAKIILLATSLLGLVLLFMTASRVSFFVLFVSLFMVVVLQKKKLILFFIPLGIVLLMFLLTFQSSLFDRFRSTVSETEVLVDAKTGESIGHVKFVPKEYFADKVVLQRRVSRNEELVSALSGKDDDQVYSSASAILPYKFIPNEVSLVTAINISTGENLPQGTSYINLYLSPVTKRVGSFFYEFPPEIKSSPSAQFIVLHGNFIIKKASAYDLSFTTRFQGEWPRAIEAFQRNILLGSGYGSVSLAVDNNYLRILGENGLLGFTSLFIIFLILSIYIRKIYPDIDSRIARSFVLGFSAGVLGLALNATLIDVFEASKIAFLFWILVGVTLKILTLYQKREFNLLNQLRKAATSTYAILIYLFLLTILLYSQMLANYFVGDDFTWLRWASDCSQNCSPVSTIARYFTDADGFFYRPGTKVYFYLMYHAFWLNQVIYHLVSILLHFSVTALLFILARKVLKNDLLAVFSALLFLILSGAVEGVFWIAATGHLFNALFGIASLILFLVWEEKKKIYYLLGSFVCVSLSLLFHELGIVFPLLIIAYKFKDQSIGGVKRLLKNMNYLVLFVPGILYLTMRFFAGSHWFQGDYSYNLIKLPLNFIGNALGYSALSLIGPMSLSLYEKFRIITRENILLTLILVPVVLILAFFTYKLTKEKFDEQEKKTIIFGLLFFIITLLPFLGLGNITSRYSYLASFGIILVFVVLVKKAYGYLLNSGREIAIGAITIFALVFVLFHIISAQQTRSEWKEAGNRAKNFFISLEGSYTDSWSKDDISFHFVDVPIRIGNAWVFPVGIEDAVWFAFRNENAKIYLDSDLNTVVQQVGLSTSDVVLEFNDDGTVTEIDRVEDPVSGKIKAVRERKE